MRFRARQKIVVAETFCVGVATSTVRVDAMGVLVEDGTSHTKFSYLEYQALMLSLAGVMCMGLFFVEIAISRFQVLPLVFPGMFTVRDRRFYFFNFDISDGALGKRVRADAKMVIRMTLCVVLSYLWQQCVLETTQQVGTMFPHEHCDLDEDCFASELHYTTFLNREHTALNCQGPREDFDARKVVTCIRFVDPSAPSWLMHLAIAHSLAHFGFRFFELLVWICGNSSCARRFVGLLIFVVSLVLLGLFFSGVISEFVSSWLSFVMALSISIWLQTVWDSGKCLDILCHEELLKVQVSIEEHLNEAFSDIEAEVAREARQADAIPAESTDAVEASSTRRWQRGAPSWNMSVTKKLPTLGRSSLSKFNLLNSLSSKERPCKSKDASPGSQSREDFSPQNEAIVVNASEDADGASGCGGAPC